MWRSSKMNLSCRRASYRNHAALARKLIWFFAPVLFFANLMEAQDVFLIRGDYNGDGRVSISDVADNSAWFWLGGRDPVCLGAADSDGDGNFSVVDIFVSFDTLFLGTDSISSPYPECGPVEDSPGTCSAEPSCAPVEADRNGIYTIFVAEENGNAVGKGGFAVPRDSELVVGAPPGTELEIPFLVYLEGGIEGRGAGAWSLGLSLASEGLEAKLVEATHEDTGGNELLTAFRNMSELVSDDAAVTAVVFDIGGASRELPSEPVSILRGSVRMTVPEEGEGLLTLLPVRGIQGSGAPVELEVWGEGRGARPDVVPLTIRVTTEGLFHRGDSNLSGNHDISDSIFILTYLFFGTTEILCMDAADNNDDGTVDISDAIAGLNCLFVGGQCNAPRPGCGLDPTPDSIGCDQGCVF